jgi:aspartate-semialdehyde dehydrogenase
MDVMLRIAVVGATGAVGTELLGLLSASELPIEYIVPAASARSAGRLLEWPLVKGPVIGVDDLDFAGLDVAFVSAGAPVSRKIAEAATAAGCLIIDNSSAFRGREDVPLPVPQVNPEVLARLPASGIVANPNCSTIQLVRALAPLHAAAELRQVVVSTYQAASGGGLRGLAELASDSAAVLDASKPTDATANGTAGRFGRPLAFDLLPQIGDLDPAGASHEERKLRNETRRILSVPGLPVAATAVRAAVFHCHSEAVYARFAGPLDAGAAQDALDAAPGLRLYRDPDFPTPRGVEHSGEGRRDVHVGRVRVDTDDRRALWMWVVADNLWVGAALNAFQILELAVANGWWG